MITTFKNKQLEAYFHHNDSSGLSLNATTLCEVSEILVELGAEYFNIDDFSLLWTVLEHEDHTSVTLTVNGTESCGAITFKYNASFVFDVDLFIED